MSITLEYISPVKNSYEKLLYIVLRNMSQYKRANGKLTNMARVACLYYYLAALVKLLFYFMREHHYFYIDLETARRLCTTNLLTTPSSAPLHALFYFTYCSLTQKTYGKDFSSFISFHCFV